MIFLAFAAALAAQECHSTATPVRLDGGAANTMSSAVAEVDGVDMLVFAFKLDDVGAAVAIPRSRPPSARGSNQGAFRDHRTLASNRG